MKLRNLLLLGSMTAVVVAITSCTKAEDLFDYDGYMAQKTSEYEANFVKKYGAVDPNKSWDLTSNRPQYSFPSEERSTRAITRDAGATYSIDEGTFYVEKTVLEWCFDKIPAGKNNSNQGNPFYLTVPGNPFTIVPIFQGNAKYYWELWMKVDGYNPIKVWAKGDNLKYKTAAGQWISVGTEQAGFPKDPVPEQVEAPSFTFSGLPENATMYFSLRKWSNYDAYTNDTDKNKYTELTSMSKKMLALKNCPVPTGVPQGNSVNIIGCEDWTDNDFEDLVFMAYGIPTITEVETLDEIFTKRYMVEDLGDTDDFDFNDVVVDVSKKLRTTFTYEVYADGTKSKIDEKGPTLVDEWAVVRAAGGTLDFTITIGSTSWTKSDHVTPVTKMVNTGLDGPINFEAKIDEFKITKKDWDYEKNSNVSITVDGRGDNQGVVYTIQFPKDGEIPKIIAVNKSEKWMYERQEVPDDWIKDDTNNQNNQNNQNDQQNQGN